MVAKKGKAFEKETADLAGKYGKRVYGSGAVGTIAGIGALTGDVRWIFPWFDKEINIECKHGYDKSKKEQKSMTVYKEWFDKHMKEVKVHDYHPAFAFKFKFTQENGMSKFILIPFSTMQKLIKQMEDMHVELEELRNANSKTKRTID